MSELKEQIQETLNEYKEFKGEVKNELLNLGRRIKVVEDKINWIMVLLIGTLATGFANLVIRFSGIK